MTEIAEFKRQAGSHAVDHLESEMVVGLIVASDKGICHIRKGEQYGKD